MGAISKAWVVIADTAVDPDSPIDATLMTGYRDDLVHLREWLGFSFFAGAVQDHNHDGLNSQLIEVGPNYIRNGTFESDTSGWTITQYGGGTVARSTANNAHGKASLGFTSTVLANGGGDATQAAFISVGGNEPYPFDAWIWASVANVSSKLEALWYDNNQAQISSSTLITLTDTPIAPTRYTPTALSPAAARYMKLKFTGGVPAAGTATGTAFFDGAAMYEPQPWVNPVSLIKRGAAGFPQATTGFAGALGNANQTEANSQFWFSEPTTISELRIASSGAIPAANTVVVTLRKGGADTILTATIAAGAKLALDVDATHNIDFGAGDAASFKIVSSATAGTNDYTITAKMTRIGTSIGAPVLHLLNAVVTVGVASALGEPGTGLNAAPGNCQVPLPRCLVSRPLCPLLLANANSSVPETRRNNVALADFFQDYVASAIKEDFGGVDKARRLFAEMDLYSFVPNPTNLATWQAAEIVNFKSADPTKYDPCPLLFSSFNQPQATT